MISWLKLASRQLPDNVADLLQEAGLELIVNKHDHMVPDSQAKIVAARDFRLEMAVYMPVIFLHTWKAKNEEEAAMLAERDVKISKRDDSGSA